MYQTHTHSHVVARFSNPNPVGSARQGHLTVHRGVGVQPFLPNGFSKSTQVHRFGAPLDTAKTLRKLDPYVARYAAVFVWPDSGPF